jgi:hypothetical protein
MTKGNGASWLSWTDAKAARTIGLTSAVFVTFLRLEVPSLHADRDVIAWLSMDKLSHP